MPWSYQADVQCLSSFLELFQGKKDKNQTSLMLCLD